MTVSNNFVVDAFGLDFFNNDCQNNGNVYCTAPASWTVGVSKNTGPFSQFLSFASIAQGLTSTYYAALNIAVTTRDTLNFKLSCANSCYSPVGTGQYVATNVHVNGITVVPEPITIWFFLFALFGLSGTVRNRSR